MTNRLALAPFAHPAANPADKNLSSTHQSLVLLLQSYGNIVLVANNPDVDLDQVQDDFGPDTVFIVFNNGLPLRTAKRFGRDLIVLSLKIGEKVLFKNRSQSRLVIAPHVKPNQLKAGIVLKDEDDPSQSVSIPGFTGPVLLVNRFPPSIYGNGSPSTGFLATLLLVEKLHLAPVTLLGFDGQSSHRKLMSDTHDWCFEQFYLRILEKKGLVLFYKNRLPDYIPQLKRCFPELPGEDLQDILNQIFVERITRTNSVIDQIRRDVKPLVALGYVEKARRKIRSKVEDLLLRLKRH